MVVFSRHRAEETSTWCEEASSTWCASIHDVISLFIGNMVSMVMLFLLHRGADSVTECLYRLVQPSSVSWFFSELLHLTALRPSLSFK